MVQQEVLVVGGKQYCIFGDAAYILRQWLQTVLAPTGATVEELSYNREMSELREAVE